MLRWFLFGKESLGAFFLDFLPQVFLAFFSGCCCSVTKSCLTLCDPVDYSTQASLAFTISWSLLKLMSIESVMPSNHLILCLLLLPPSIFSSIRVFSNESALHIRWPKYWSFSFNISPSSEHPGLISFRMDWLNLPCSPRDSQDSPPTLQFNNIQYLTITYKEKASEKEYIYKFFK